MLLVILMAILPHCQFEDSDFCAWDATQFGNNTGSSFISIAGYVFEVKP